MNAQPTHTTPALDVSIDIHHEPQGFVSARVYRLDGTLIVMTPPCDTQDGAVSVAKAMWRTHTLAIPASLAAYGTA